MVGVVGQVLSQGGREEVLVLEACRAEDGVLGGGSRCLGITGRNARGGTIDSILPIGMVVGRRCFRDWRIRNLTVLFSLMF
jgi:hypothetical protein